MPYKDPAVNLARTNERYAAMTPEQRAARLAYQREYHQANRDRARSSQQAWREKNGHGDNPDTARAAYLRRKYGITVQEYEEMLAGQNGRCASCGSTEPGNGRSGEPRQFFSVDHDHVTGKIRGLLCQPCNLALGFADDDPNRLLALAAYVLQNQDVVARLGQGACNG